MTQTRESCARFNGKASAVWPLIAVTLMLTACSSAPVLQNKVPALGPDEGIAAVLVDSRDPISQLTLERARRGGTTIDVPAAPVGKSLYLVAAKAGQYCVVSFRYGDYRFHSPHHDLDCFIVEPGRIAYSGSLMPEATPGDTSAAILEQAFKPDDFIALLYRDYPAIAAKFPIEGLGLAAGRGAGLLTDYRSHVLGAKIEDVDGAQAQAIYFRNNASWKMEIVNFRLSNCQNVKEKCVLTHPQLMLQPGQEKRFIVLHGADPAKAFSYHFDYRYRRP